MDEETRMAAVKRRGQNADDRPVYLKPARAARLLDCSKSKIYQAISAGQIKATRVAGMLRIHISEIERLAHQDGESDRTVL